MDILLIIILGTLGLIFGKNYIVDYFYAKKIEQKIRIREKLENDRRELEKAKAEVEIQKFNALNEAKKADPEKIIDFYSARSRKK